MSEPKSTFVTAVNKNGDKQRIPREWLDHPIFSKQFRLPPSARSESKANQASKEKE